MNTIYGHFSDDQLEEYKVKLHKELFWLLLYKDPNTKDNYSDVDFDGYFEYLMRKLDGLNELLEYPPILIEIMAILEAALLEAQSKDFQYKTYRKLILDAHHLVDKLWKGDYARF